MARKAASVLLPLLQLEAKSETTPVLTLGPPSPPAIDGFTLQVVHPAHGSVMNLTSTINKREALSVHSRSGTRAPKKSGRREGQGEVPGGESGSVGMRLQPPPLCRLPSPGSDRLPFGNRCLVERAVEQQSEDLGTSGDETAGHLTFLLKQAIRRFQGDVAIVRVVLDPARRCEHVHPDPGVTKGVTGLPAGGGDTVPCELRCLLRIEAYLPASSKIACLYVTVMSRQVCPTGVTTFAQKPSSVGVDPFSGDAFTAVAYACRSRRRQRMVLEDMRQTEMAVGMQCISELLRKAAVSPNGSGTLQGVEAKAGGAPVYARVNNAFSVLLIRADVRVPVSRVNLGSGSWKETASELVGCPSDVALKTVSTPDFCQNLVNMAL